MCPMICKIIGKSWKIATLFVFFKMALLHWRFHHFLFYSHLHFQLVIETLSKSETLPKSLIFHFIDWRLISMLSISWIDGKYSIPMSVLPVSLLSLSYNDRCRHHQTIHSFILTVFNILFSSSCYDLMHLILLNLIQLDFIYIQLLQLDCLFIFFFLFLDVNLNSVRTSAPFSILSNECRFIFCW